MNTLETVKMTNPELIADEIYRELFENYLEEQIEELSSADIKELDPVYVPMFEFYRSSSEEGKTNIIDYIKEIIADTTSIVLGGIDQVEPLGELTGNFELKYDGEVVSGNLQENFLLNFQDEEESDGMDESIY